MILWKPKNEIVFCQCNENGPKVKINLLNGPVIGLYFCRVCVWWPCIRQGSFCNISVKNISKKHSIQKKLPLLAIVNDVKPLSLIEIKKVVKCHRLWLLKLLIQCLYKLEMCTGMERSAIEKELFFQFLVFFKANPIFQKTNFLVAQTEWGNVAKLLLYCFKTHNCNMHSTLNIYETLKTILLWKSKEKVLWKQWLVFAKYFVALSVFNLIFLFVGFLKEGQCNGKKRNFFFLQLLRFLWWKNWKLKKRPNPLSFLIPQVTFLWRKWLHCDKI